MKQADYYQNKTIWIIGASEGIGHALCQQFEKLGTKLIISARQQQKLDQLMASASNYLASYALDVTDFSAFEKTCQQVFQAYKLDSIIYLPAFYQPGRLDDINLNNVKQTIDVNLISVFYLLKLIKPYLAQHKHCQLAVVASIAGYIGLPSSQPYAATKAAVINLIESFYTENPNYDIKLINPGFVKTRLTAKNTFNMPAIISSEKAAQAIINGLKKNIFEIHFSKKLSIFLKLLQKLPYAIYFKIARRFQ